MGMQVAGTGKNRIRGVSIRWLILVPLALGLLSEIGFSLPWLQLVPADPQVQSVIEALRTPALQWVEVPFGEHFFVAPAEVAGLKITDGLLRWSWKGRMLPTGLLVATRIADRGGNLHQVGAINDVHIFRDARAEYAVLSSSAGDEACSGSGEGGSVDVTSRVDSHGVLTVKEHSLVGWRAWRDGEPIPLEPAQWLTMRRQQEATCTSFAICPGMTLWRWVYR